MQVDLCISQLLWIVERKVREEMSDRVVVVAPVEGRYILSF